MSKKVFTNRELSWIDFNLRVLDEARRPENPLLERLKFIAIFQSNFNEFYRVRVGTLHDGLLVERHGERVQRELEDIYKATRAAYRKADEVYEQLLREAQEFQALLPEQLTERELSRLTARFERDIAPIISPFIVEKKHPFPFFENGATIIGVTLKRKSAVKFGFIPITGSLPPLLRVSEQGNRFVLIEDALRYFADRVFRRFEVAERISFTILRNADIDENEGLYEYDVDYRDKMSKLIELRRKLAPVALKYNGGSAPLLLAHLRRVLYLSKKQLISQRFALDMSFCSKLQELLPPTSNAQLYFPPRTPRYPRSFKKGQIIKHLQRRDELLSYPFDDIEALIDLLDEAAHSPAVRSISISLYRVAKNSRIVQLLCEAAKNKKPVHCVVELRARFDEENNIDWSVRLEQAGCHVYYGLPNYKVHCKLLHIAMRDGTPDVVMIGTGNFNEQTARAYTDLALFTAHSGIVREVRAVFTSLKKGRFVEHSRHLLVAPLCMKSRLFELIDEQIRAATEGRAAEITLKFNSLTDKPLMKKLIEASCAGVRIRMLIRGVCCLVPGVPGKTENIEIRSIVGRFLEHSRIYVFGVGRERRYYISSADFMTRNTDQRVEVAAPVYDYTARRRLAGLLRLGFADNTNARRQNEHGEYENTPVGRRSINMQNELYAHAAERSADKNEKDDIK